MRVHVLGGFLGAGKTTLARALARDLDRRGERVVLITNDQGRSLVDTSLCEQDGVEVQEISGGCFCCRYDELEGALLGAAESGATVAVAEAVGSCTDLVATVLAPLADRYPDRFEIEPLGVVVDPWRVLEFESGDLPLDVEYLFHKQIEEADVVLVSRLDLDPPDVASTLRGIRPDAAIVAVSGTTGAGLDSWLSAEPASLAGPLDLDYERYANAEALLGWCNARVRVTAPESFDVAAMMRDFLLGLTEAPIAHVKVLSVDPLGIRGALTRRGGDPTTEGGGRSASIRDTCWIVNARVALPPVELEALLRTALATAVGTGSVAWEEIACFRPGRPTPQHRYGTRTAPDSDASCCAAFYGRTEVRALLGDSFHPGGLALTRSLADDLALKPDDAVLDVACGSGASLRAIVADHSVRGFGMDTAAPFYSDERLELRPGDAHAVPWEDEHFSAVFCECALSTFTDAPGALAEMRRVLLPGGRLALTDMVLEGETSPALRDWVHVGTCLSGAMTFRGYEGVLEEAGFRVIHRRLEPGALRELLGRVKRNLVGVALAAATGNLGANVKIDVQEGRDLLREAADAVSAGTISYGIYVAERPA